jgi:nifR3 family TIM-barrel protein
MLPWFKDGKRPLYLAPMAGVTDSVFRQLCKEQGADVLVTEFVSADGILHRNQRTREMIRFVPAERPVGVQLFGAEPSHLAEAAQAVADWVQPDFIDLNFGCPVNKVVCKQGGSALLRNCPLLAKVAAAVVRAIAPVPVTAKIRLGWDAKSINAMTTGKILEDVGVQALAVHGRTKEQGYGGIADWDRIAEVAASLGIPVIGNGDISSAKDIRVRLRETKVAGVMIGRAAMTSPWLFRQAKDLLNGDIEPAEPTLEQRWAHIRRHCRLAVVAGGAERPVMTALRGRLMAYSKGMPGGRHLRSALQMVSTLRALELIAEDHLAWVAQNSEQPELAAF